jgi:hypothetical protein
MIWKLAGADSQEKFEAASGPVLEMFTQVGDLYCYRKLMEQDKEIRQVSQSRSDAGKNGAKSRWQGDGKPIASAILDDDKQITSATGINGKPIASAIPDDDKRIADLDIRSRDRRDEDKNIAPSGASAPGGADSVTHGFMDVWNLNCGPLPKIREITTDRAKKIRGKLRSNQTFQRDFEAAIKRAALNPFTAGGNDSGWRADFDWMLDNHHKVLEGSYDSAPKNDRRERGGAYRSTTNSSRFDRAPDIVID